MALVSIVVPVCNESGNVGPLADRIVEAMAALSMKWELLFVNDGSNDSTWREIQDYGARDQRVKGVNLSRRFGHQHALVAGLSMADGEAVISMDGDLQHPPELIPDMLRLWQGGARIVCTERTYSEATPVLKRWGSRYFYRTFSALAETQVEEGSSDFRLLDRSVVNMILQFRDPEPFLRGSVSWVGFKVETLVFEAGERHAGSTKYRLRDLLRFAATAIPAYSTKPLSLGIWMGFLTGCLAFLEVIYVLVQHFSGNTVPGWASLMVVMSVLFGILFMVIGILGVYIGAIHRKLQDRPLYIVAESTNLEDREI